ncbi:MAG: hypothetical protein LQ350_008153 [Teloschistes chrysophthalmus]|nr:MAG: hypothetical protein LQ350_008153 [Niorma chrysophthalma]
MSGPRLTFLYPSLFKPALFREPTAAAGRLRHLKPSPHKYTLSTSAPRKQETYAQRYGSATEPQLPPPSQPPVPNDLGREKSLAGAFEKEVKAPASTNKEQKAEAKAQSKETSKPMKEAAKPKESEPSPSPSEGKEKPSIDAQAQQKLNPTESPPKENPPPTTTTTSAKEVPDSKPLDTVLNRTVASPSPSTSSEEHKPPHMQAPPHLHNFDTYSLVRSLHTGGFTPPQSITLMKTVRGLLTANLSLARSGLVSRSDVENETYLFRAACSELRTEIANARRLSHQKTSTQLAHLQHEVEILGQRVTQESSALKDELRGMLNDRRMAVRMEQQGMEQGIQELNYKITVALNSEAKSEVEGMRWVLTKRTALALGGMAFFIFNCLLLMRSRDHEAKRLAAEKNPPSPPSSNPNSSPNSSSSSTGSGGNYTVPSREMSTQTTGGGGGSADTEAMLANVSKDGSPAYISLG